MTTLHVYMRTLALLAFATLSTGCMFSDMVQGSGKVERRTLDVAEFDAIVVRGSMDVILTRSEQRSVEVEAQPNIADLLKTEVSNGTWTISTTEGYSTRKDFIIQIAVPELKRVTVEGSGDVKSKDIFPAKEMSVEVKGSGDVQLGVEASRVIVEVKGSGDITLHGRCDELEASVHGSGDINAVDLECENAKASVMGSGDISVHATGVLDARVKGSGDIRHRGDPARVDRDVKGSGDVSRIK